VLHRVAFIIVVSLALFALNIFFGCEGDQGPEGAVGPQGPTGEPGPTEINIMAIMEVSEDIKAFDVGEFAMSIYNAPSIPHVRLNNKDIMPDDMGMFDEGRLVYKEYFGLVRDDSAFLDISYTKLDGSPGAASSDISLPAQFAVIDPVRFILVNEDPMAEWDMSQGADAYWVYYYFSFGYDDTAGVYQMIEVTCDTVMAADDTSLTVPASIIFPPLDEIGEIHSFVGSFDLRAVTGPWFPGEMNNFSGDAYGVFVGSTGNKHVDVHLTAEFSAPKIEIDGESHNAGLSVNELFNQRVGRLCENRAE
jgi:hypothetical protein